MPVGNKCTTPIGPTHTHIIKTHCPLLLGSGNTKKLTNDHNITFKHKICSILAATLQRNSFTPRPYILACVNAWMEET